MGRRIVIEVSGGVASCTEDLPDVDVVIRDLDNIEAGDPDPMAGDAGPQKLDVKESQDDFDAFLDEATHTLSAMWQDSGGTELNFDDLYAINDLLSQYFGNKRS